SRADAADGLHGGVGNGDAVRAKGHCFDEVRRRAKAACNDQCYVPTALLIEETARSGQCWNCRNGDVVPDDQRSSSRPTAATIEKDVVRGGIKGEGDVVFDMLGRELETDWDPSGQFADSVGETLEVVAR